MSENVIDGIILLLLGVGIKETANKQINCLK
jgi:hypothetical protein